jgi:hypothetical protein
MLFNRVDHIAIAVKDTGDALAFYRDTLGFPVVLSDVVNDPSVRLSVAELQKKAVDVCVNIIHMIAAAQAGHPGGSLSAADIVTTLYFRLMRIDPQRPHWPDRDRFILSKGHACPVWYAALAERGSFDKSHLDTPRKLDSILQGHADIKKTPGFEKAIELVSCGKVDPTPIVTHHLPMDEAQCGFELAASKDDGAIKVALTYDT